MEAKSAISYRKVWRIHNLYRYDSQGKKHYTIRQRAFTRLYADSREVH